MELRLIKDWKRGEQVVKKGTVVEVDANLAKRLIKDKIAKVNRDFLFGLVKKEVPDDGTKQTRRKQRTKKKEE